MLLSKSLRSRQRRIDTHMRIRDSMNLREPNVASTGHRVNRVTVTRYALHFMSQVGRKDTYLSPICTPAIITLIFSFDLGPTRQPAPMVHCLYATFSPNSHPVSIVLSSFFWYSCGLKLVQILFGSGRAGSSLNHVWWGIAR